ncbi:59e5f51b-0ff1-4722-a9e3-1089cb751af6 [Thermothielavioides terrestris]|uniref:59e5f51b-0ff1-4722-a9e3-1089cb751af6 n=1 Tax=Thermothielavioides terrestris TaxID=2587410 RepID=A0A3S5CXP5_9PEZI|nr:59e5f51b-0ff1-4722-a9e3-1089cb751af6 [Thermothielavioides terrestris]
MRTEAAGQVVTFNNVSSPELAELLDTLRQKVFLPTYLSKAQRQKIHDPKYERALKHDPITMEIDGEKLQFRYVDRMKEMPNTVATIRRVINAMKTRADFDNVFPLLEGCQRARRRLPPSTWPKLIRRAAEHDNLRVIMDCVKEVEETGFRLNTSEKVAELLSQFQRPAIESGFDLAKTTYALRQVNLVLNILEGDLKTEQHKPTRGAGRFPFYRDPQMLAVRLHLAAALAVHHSEGKDPKGRVASYAQELVALWPENAGLLDLQPDEAFRDRERMRYLLDRNNYLWYAAPILNGLTLAAQVVDPALAMQLQNRADAVESEVRVALDSLEVKDGRGKYIYDKLFNTEAKEEEEKETTEAAEGA